MKLHGHICGRRIAARLLTVCLVAGLLSGLRAQDVSIADWRGDATAAFSLSADDYATQYFRDIATYDSTTVNRGMRMSFGMIARWSACYAGCQQNAWNLGQTLVSTGHDILSHSMTHERPGTYAEDTLQAWSFAWQMDSSQVDIEKNIPNARVLFYEFPGGIQSKDDDHAYLRSKRWIGVRTGGGVNPTSFDPFDALWWQYTNGRGLSFVTNAINEAISKRGWGHVAFHNINTGGWQPVPLNIWIAILDELKTHMGAGEMWVAPVNEVVMYAMERDHFTASIANQQASGLEIEFNTSSEINPSPLVDNTVYDVALTLKLTAPNSDLVLFDADPWGGNVTVTLTGGGVIGVSQGGADIPFSVNGQTRVVRELSDGSAVRSGVPLRVSVYGLDGSLLRTVSGPDALLRSRSAQTPAAGLEIMRSAQYGHRTVKLISLPTK